MTKYQFSLVLLTSVLSFSSSLQAACVTGDCAEMGYTKSENACSGDIIRCPFDTSKVFCKETKNYITKPCNSIGDVVYSDKVCAGDINNIDPSKTIIGVVANTNPRFVIFLDEPQANWNEANSYLSLYSIGNIRGWKLPTKDELQIIYNNKDKINETLTKLQKITLGVQDAGFGDRGIYWSSTTESGADWRAWNLDFTSGEWDGSSKTNLDYLIRGIINL